MAEFSKKSLERLNSCHTDLIRLFTEVIKRRDCTILCGHRNKADQDAAFARGVSRLKFPNSRHNSVPSEAVDVVPFPIPDWSDIAAFSAFVDLVKQVAKEMKIEITCGADWPKLQDYPHFELKRKSHV